MNQLLKKIKNKKGTPKQTMSLTEILENDQDKVLKFSCQNSNEDNGGKPRKVWTKFSQFLSA